MRLSFADPEANDRANLDHLLQEESDDRVTETSSSAASAIHVAKRVTVSLFA